MYQALRESGRATVRWLFPIMSVQRETWPTFGKPFTGDSAPVVQEQDPMLRIIGIKTISMADAHRSAYMREHGV